MARPIKTGLDYFPFDVDLFQDEKVVAIAGEFGLKGEIIIVKLLCAIYRNGYFIRWSDMLKYKLLSELQGVSADLLDSVVSRLVKWDFFNKDLFESDGILTSYGIQRRYHAICCKMHRKEIITVYSLLGDVMLRPVQIKDEPKEQPRKPAPAPSPPVSAPAFHPAPKIKLDESIPQLKADTIWAEPVCMRYSIEPGNLSKIIDDFKEYCISYGENEHDDIKHVKRHFCQWLNKQKYSQYKKQPTAPAPSSHNYEYTGGFGGKDT